MWYNEDCNHLKRRSKKESTSHYGMGPTEIYCETGGIRSGGCPKRCIFFEMKK